MIIIISLSSLTNYRSQLPDDHDGPEQRGAELNRRLLLDAEVNTYYIRLTNCQACMLIMATANIMPMPMPTIMT